MLTTDELVKQVFPALHRGVKEIRPGQTKMLARMSRLAPGFIANQRWKTSKV